MRKPNFCRSVRNALNGIFSLARTERNFRFELLAFAVNLALILILKVESGDAAILILASFVVLIAESFNTVVERLCDFIYPEFDDRIGRIKDLAAGAVLLSALASVILALIIYPSYVF